MKNGFFILMLLLPFLVAGQQPLNQTDSLGRKQGFWQKRYPDGILMYEGWFKNNKPTGNWKRYYESGALKAILQYSENSDSVKTRLFESSDKPVAQGYYIGEKKAGVWSYFSDGVKIAEENYVNGFKNGICKKFYKSGELLETSVWKDNQMEGKYSAFFLSGKPYMECMYRNNQRNGQCLSYFQSGITEVESYYLNDLPEGTWKYYDENGNLRYSLNYENGILKNTEVLLKLDSQTLNDLEKQRNRLADPEKYLQSPEEYPGRKQ